MKELKDMTISDVLKTPEFYNNLKVVISDLENTRRNAGISANAPLKRIAICKVCKGERKNHKGYMWRYKNEKA